MALTPKEIAKREWIRRQNFRDKKTGKFRKPTQAELDQFEREYAKQNKASTKAVAKSREKPETLLQKLERQARARKIEKHSAASYAWFRDRVRTLGGNKARDTLLDDGKRSGRLRDAPTVGKMYTYVYDAKHKDKLPYWDAFPLIFMVGPAPKGFYGINLHYLPPKPRAQLFDKLLEISNTQRYNARTKLQMSYSLLKGSSKFKLFKPCFKHYLFSQVQSRLVLISADEWESALFLPTADFQKAANSKVWSDSILKVT